MRYTGLSDIEGVKRLLILLLLKLGTPSKEIGMALNIDSSIIRRMFPGKEIRRIKNLSKCADRRASYPAACPFQMTFVSCSIKMRTCRKRLSASSSV